VVFPRLVLLSRHPVELRARWSGVVYVATLREYSSAPQSMQDGRDGDKSRKAPG
jgi:hypothetical protein